MLRVCVVVKLQCLCFGKLHLETYESISCTTKGYSYLYIIRKDGERGPGEKKI